MKTQLYVGAGAVAVAGVAAFVWLGRSPEAALAEHWAMLDSHCVECHNDYEVTGGVSFEGLSPSDVVADRALFEGE